MCGITGIFRSGGLREDDRAAVARMTRVLAHRGPDGEGTFVGRDIALGHRRLIVIDPQGGRQPVSNEDGSVRVVFNGEIYNHAELRAALQAKGHRFASRCDTEVLPHAYEQWGPEFVNRLHGMFAIAVYDAVRRRLILVRDRLGVKPLYWARCGGAILFGSELKAILQGPGARAGEFFPRRPDIAALHACLTYRYIPGRKTGFVDVESVAPGAYLRFDETMQPRWNQYWQPPPPPAPTPARRAQSRPVVAEAAAAIEQATRCRLESDVPLGAFLSGGVDSAVIVSEMRRALGRSVTAFTIGYEEAGVNEIPAAAAAAAHLDVEHRTQVIRPDAARLLPELVWAADEPFADSSLLPTYMLCRWAREHVTVALSGDGGDEAFAGYERYRGVPLARRLRPLARLLAGVLPSPARSALRSFRGRHSLRRRLWWLLEMSRAPGGSLGAIYDHCMGHQDGVDAASLWTGDVRSALRRDGTPAGYVDLVNRYAARNPSYAMSRADYAIYLPDDVLMKVDRASMAHGLEVRSPLLDHRLVEFSLGLLSELRAPGGRRKHLLRKIAAERLPPGHLAQPKRGFAVPLDDWFRGSLGALARDTIINGGLVAEGLLAAAAVEHLFAAHAAARANLGERLWTLLCLELWHRTYIRPAAPPTGPITWDS